MRWLGLLLCMLAGCHKELPPGERLRVEVAYPGASAAQVEQGVLGPLEAEASQAQVSRIDGVALPARAILDIELAPGASAVALRERLSGELLRRLPQDVLPPVFSFAEQGCRQQELEVLLDPDRLASSGISLETLLAALQRPLERPEQLAQLDLGGIRLGELARIQLRPSDCPVLRAPAGAATRELVARDLDALCARVVGAMKALPGGGSTCSAVPSVSVSLGRRYDTPFEDLSLVLGLADADGLPIGRAPGLRGHLKVPLESLGRLQLETQGSERVRLGDIATVQLQREWSIRHVNRQRAITIWASGPGAERALARLLP